MVATTRPYFLTFKGEQRMIDAPSAAAAVQQVVGADVTDLRPARGAEVSAWVRSGKKLETYQPRTMFERLGDAAARSAPIEAAPVDPATDEPATETVVFTAADAQAWLIDNGAKTPDLAVWRRIVETDRMTLADFDEIRVAVPQLNAALIATILLKPYPAANEPLLDGDIATIRTQMEEEPFPLIVVVGAIAQAKQAELFEAAIEPLPTEPLSE